MLITSNWVVDLLIISATFTFLFYKYLTRKYEYFTKRGIPFKRPIPFFGSFLPMISMRLTLGKWLQDLCKTFDNPYFGVFVFDEPYLIVKSPQLIKQILVKDFNYFTDRTILAPKHNEILSNMLFIQKNPDWKKTRTKITTVFSSGKLKGMFTIINGVGVELNQFIRKNLGQLETKEVSARYSTDVIAKCAFAISSRCFEQADPEFRQVGRSLFDFRLKNGLIQIAYLFKQNWASALHLEFIEQWAMAFLKNVFWNAIKTREQTQNKGNDLIDILVEMRKNKELCEELNFYGDKVLAQAVQFLTAGFETTSSTIAFTLYELCVQPDIQDSLRKEILNNIRKYNGITYEGLKELKYMEMCISETLRKYPVLPFLDRRCNEDYKIPGTDHIIEKGMPVYIPMMALHYDENYFPQPEKYIPERFSDQTSHNLDGLYYMPFGGGPRICIGERFGMLGVKVGLTHILSEFVVEKVPKTPVPIKFEPKSFVLQSTVGLPMKFSELKLKAPHHITEGHPS